MRTMVRRIAAAAAPLAAAAALLPASQAAGAAADAAEDADLHLITLKSGASLSEGGRLLDAVGAGKPVYRWTHALTGFAVPLTDAQANDLRAERDVALVEPDRRRRLAGVPVGEGRAGSPYAEGRGGAGTVIGVIDSGLWPESPVFAAARGLRETPGFRGTCQAGSGWPSSACNEKVVAAHWFISGFGEENVRSKSSLSARDDSGHGTQVASLAAGNAGVSVDLAGRPAGVYSGVAPRARLAVYKACWSAPDPVDDGCSTADLVAAIDQAVADGVDVLNLSVTGSHDPGTVEQALLGAAEADVAVVAAAGNGGRRSFATHSSPWVTTVGGLTGTAHRGVVELTGGLRLSGAMLSTAGTKRAPLVRGAQVAAEGATRANARVCRPGSLDARRVAGAVVVCERGGLGRIDKSEAVDRADGRGMVLLNEPVGRDNVAADLHAVPTVHLDRAASSRLRRQFSDGQRLRARLLPSSDGAGAGAGAPRLLGSSPTGDPAAGVLKPDVVAPASGLLGAAPPGSSGTRWNVLAGTSAAAGQVSGLVARMRSDHPLWSAAAVRSALTTAASPVAGSVVRTGAGRASTAKANRVGLVFEVGEGAYRRYLTGDLASSRLNTPSIIVRPSHAPVTRTVTNRSGQRRTWAVSTNGFRQHDVTVSPTRMTLDPGESRQFRVFTRGAGGLAYDGGFIVWRSPGQAAVRIPVLMGR